MSDPMVWDPTDPAHIADPYPAYAVLRRDHPVWHSTAGYWVLSRHADIEAAMTDHRFASNDTSGGAKVAPPGPDVLPPTGRRTAEFFSHWMTFASDEADHRRLRKLYLLGFTARSMREFRPTLERLVDEALAEVGGPAFDLMSALAEPLPVAVICEVLGVPAELRSVMRELAHPLARAFHAVPLSQAEMAALDAAIELFQTAILDFVEHCRRRPGTSLIAQLVRLEQEERALSEDELVSGMANLFFGGHHTSVLYLGNGMLALLRDPAQADLLRTDPSLAASAAEELLRYDSPAQTGAARFTTEDVRLHDRTIPAGEKVLLLVGSANRDETVYDHADRLDLARVNQRPLVMGRGLHTCIGAPLARLEGEVAFPRILATFPTLRLGDTEPERSEHTLFRGLRSLPVAL